MPIWMILTLCAAVAQTTRFALQKRLAGGRLSPAGATFARFLFAAPLAVGAAAAGLAGQGLALPPLPAAFWGFVLLGGVAQIVATELTVALFAMRNFTVGVAFTKTEVVQAALFSLIVLGEKVSAGGVVAIAAGLAGMLVLARPPEPGAPLLNRAAAYGLAAGALFGVAAVGFRGATQALPPLPFVLTALVTLAAATCLQTALMAVWLRLRAPGQVGRTLRAWRATLPVGLTGALGSFFWFAAFALQNAAYVRALGQIEIVFTLAASTLIFGETLRGRELAGVALVVASVLILVLSLG